MSHRVHELMSHQGEWKQSSAVATPEMLFSSYFKAFLSDAS